MASPPDSVVLLHGFGSTFEHNWVQTGWVDILGDFDCTVPPIDLPGHGRSDRSTDPGAYGSVEEDIARTSPTTSTSTISIGVRIA